MITPEELRKKFAAAVPRLTTISDETMLLSFSECEKLLADQKKLHIAPAWHWANSFPLDAGVYTVFEGDAIIYVGETQSLRKRLTQLVATGGSHVLRRTIGREIFEEINGVPFAKGAARLPDEIDRKAVDRLQQLRIAAVVVPFGRSEIEEYIIGKHRPRYNSKKNRETRPDQNESKRARK